MAIEWLMQVVYSRILDMNGKSVICQSRTTSVFALKQRGLALAAAGTVSGTQDISPSSLEMIPFSYLLSVNIYLAIR